MLLKVCGLTDPYNITDVAQHNLDFAGLIFVKESPRYVGSVDDISSDLVHALSVLKRANTKIIGVFKDPSKFEIELAISNYGLDGVQLHGNESPDFCSLISTLSSELIIIKALSINSENLQDYYNCTDYLLFDTPGENGGSGIPWDINVLNSMNIDKPYFIAGGIDYNKAQEILNSKSRGQLLGCVGIDINSSVEVKPGFKNSGKVKTMRDFVKGI